MKRVRKTICSSPLCSVLIFRLFLSTFHTLDHRYFSQSEYVLAELLKREREKMFDSLENSLSFSLRERFSLSLQQLNVRGQILRDHVTLYLF